MKLMEVLSMDIEKKDAKKVEVKVEAGIKAAPKAEAKKVEVKKAEAVKSAPVAAKKVAKKTVAKKAVAKKPVAKKAAKSVDVIIEIDGQQISVNDIIKKVSKGGKIYVNTNEKIAYLVDGEGVDLF